MDLKKTVLAIVLLTFCLNLDVFTGMGVNIPVYVGVKNDHPSESVLVPLEVRNYSVFVHVEGLLNFQLSHTTFNIIKNSRVYFTVTTGYPLSLMNYSKEGRIIITEAEKYNFSFYIDGGISEYLNYEVLLAETEIVYHPKTSIISKAPYGLTFMLIALIGVSFLNIQRRKRE